MLKFAMLMGGRRLAYRDSGHGPALVMLHGWGHSSVAFERVRDCWNGPGRLLAPDLPGHGHSGPGRGYELPLVAQDLLEWLDELKVQDLVLLGWSFGGQLALEMVRHLGGRLRALLLVASTPCFVQKDCWAAGQPVGRLRLLERQLRRDFLGGLEGFFRSQFQGETLANDLLESLWKEQLRRADPPREDATLAGLRMLAGNDWRTSLPVPACPVLVQHGAEDVVIPVAAGRFLADRLPGSRLELWSGCGHAPMLSRPQSCARLWQEYLVE